LRGAARGAIPEGGAITLGEERKTVTFGGGRFFALG